jgi:hypothetical protein
MRHGLRFYEALSRFIWNHVANDDSHFLDLA